jgi:hypothetical protein
MLRRTVCTEVEDAVQASNGGKVDYVVRLLGVHDADLLLHAPE